MSRRSSNLTPETPLSKLYSAFYALLLHHEPFASQFKPGNFIRFDDKSLNPKKQAVGVADLPMCTLYPASVRADEVTSSTSVFLVGYQLVFNTKDFRQERVNDITWHGVIAIMQWKRLINTVDFGFGTEQRVVTDVDIPDGQQGKADNLVIGDRSPLIEGWDTLFQINIRMHFNTADILPDIPAGTQLQVQ